VALCTNTTGVGTGASAQSSGLIQVSTITDAIILLRYVEVQSEIRRCLTVLKMRGSGHDKTIREDTIGDTGSRWAVPYRRPLKK
jgi:circadian clock protein KaiC